MENKKCKICRRLGVKLFLKGEHCLGVKCAMIKRPYAPGQKAKKRRNNLSEYGKELKEKQKLKNWYNLSEKQFSNYVKSVLDKRSGVKDAGELLLEQLESRFDNVVFQMGVVSSRVQARQSINHGFFLLNGRKVNIPSCKIKKGDKITLHPKASKGTLFSNVKETLKNHKPPSWMRTDVTKLEAEITGQPSLEEMAPPAEISSIFEFYSK
ncbi:30S ribosomal protein S4 [Patescibacteria group bacterium]|nr:30S ribosomal protein S4 [Patescibacteria group bacterium]